MTCDMHNVMNHIVENSLVIECSKLSVESPVVKCSIKA